MKRLDPRRLANPRLCVQSLEPIYGDNYRAGFVGFSYSGSVSKSRGIAHISRWARMSDVLVDRVFIVVSDGEAVEVARGREVVRFPLRPLFDEAGTQVFFRKPKKCTPALGARIAESAVAQVGTKVDQLILAARVLEGSFARRWVKSHFPRTADVPAAKLASRDAAWLGAELAAYCLDSQPEYAGRGVLGRTASAVLPQDLFEDEELFAAWHNQPVEGPSGNAH